MGKQKQLGPDVEKRQEEQQKGGGLERLGEVQEAVGLLFCTVSETLPTKKTGAPCACGDCTYICVCACARLFV